MNPNYGAFGSSDLFRGHGNDGWHLTPSLFRERKGGLFPENPWQEVFHVPGNSEIGLLLHFVFEADRRGFEIPGGGADIALHKLRTLFFQSPGDSPVGYEANGLLNVLALAQHSGVPTRLLDWTTSPWTAAYFAARDHLREKERPDYLSIWITNRYVTEQFSMTSVVPIIEDGKANGRMACLFKLRFLPISGSANPSLRAQAGELMYPTFNYTVNYSEHGDIPAIRDRFARSAAINIEGLMQQLLDWNEHPEPFARPFTKLRLRSEQAPDLIRMLDLYGYNGATTYPGMAGVADSARERILYGQRGPSSEPILDLERKSESWSKLYERIVQQSPE